jgi:hypothetical protein
LLLRLWLSPYWQKVVGVFVRFSCAFIYNRFAICSRYFSEDQVAFRFLAFFTGASIWQHQEASDTESSSNMSASSIPDSIAVLSINCLLILTRQCFRRSHVRVGATYVQLEETSLSTWWCQGFFCSRWVVPSCNTTLINSESTLLGSSNCNISLVFL